MLARMSGVLICPRCRQSVAQQSAAGEFELSCPKCAEPIPRQGDQFVFSAFPPEPFQADWLNNIKQSAKLRLGKYYPLAIELLSPVYARRFVASFLKTFDLERELVVDLGSGTSQYRERVACVDGAAYPNCHVVARLEDLPFQDDSFNGIISVAVLEHVPAPHAHVREMWRILKPGGRVLCFIPFMQGFHASPHDYQRYTHNGLRQLFSEFDVIDVQVGAGPTSGMLWVLQEWLALVLSFGSERLYRLLVPVTWILSPLKWLDWILDRHSSAYVIASGFVIEARKPQQPA